MFAISKDAFKRAMEEHGSRKIKVAQALGISTRTADRLVKKFGFKFVREKYTRTRTERVEKVEVQEIQHQFKKAFKNPGMSMQGLKEVYTDEDSQQMFALMRGKAFKDKTIQACIKLIEKGNVQFVMFYLKSVWGFNDSCTLTQNNYNVTESQRESDKVVILEKETLE